MSAAGLREAYAGAEYRVRWPGADLVLRVGQQNPAGDERLRTAGVRGHWAIVTPCNPRSQARAPVDNAKALQKLQEALQQAGIKYLDSVNRDPAGSWPDEPGFLLCDPLPDFAEALGRRFEQHAILAGHLGQAPQLIWLD